jgi:RIO-like serine/threonine protein kinase
MSHLLQSFVTLQERRLVHCNFSQLNYLVDQDLNVSVSVDL